VTRRSWDHPWWGGLDHLSDNMDSSGAPLRGLTSAIEATMFALPCRNEFPHFAGIWMTED
jgi:hypothetical protein